MVPFPGQAVEDSPEARAALVALASPPPDFDARSQRARDSVKRRARVRLRKAGVEETRWPEWLRPLTTRKPRKRRAHAVKASPAKAIPEATADSPATACAPEHAPEYPAEHADGAHVVSEGIATFFALAVGVGAYTVLFLILEPLRGALAAALLALVPMGVECIAGRHVHRLQAQGRKAMAALWVAVILGCAGVDIIAATVAPSVSARQQQQAILKDQQEHQGGEVKLQAAAEGSGKRAKLEHEKNQGAALALQKSRDEAAQKLTQERLALAKQTTGGEEWLFIALAIFGAVGSSCFLPLLESYLRARGLWRQQRHKGTRSTTTAVPHDGGAR